MSGVEVQAVDIQPVLPQIQQGIPIAASEVKGGFSVSGNEVPIPLGIKA